MSETQAFDANNESLTADQWAALRNQQVRGENPEVPKVEPPAAKETSEAKPQEGKEPSKEAEQDKERDEHGKFKAREPKVEFTPEQQAAFDKAFSRREAKIRREYEAKIAELGKTQGTEPVKTETSTAPQKPELPKLSEYKGTIEEYEKEVKDYPARLAAYLEAERQHSERIASLERRNKESEAKALKTHADYKEEFEALTKDIANNDEPKLPDYVLQALAVESEDPHELAYYLAKNREEFRRFAALKPDQVLREVIKLDAKLSFQAQTPPAQEKKQAPAKPAPPAPVGARAASMGFDVNDEAMSAEEWVRQRNKQLAERGR